MDDIDEIIEMIKESGYFKVEWNYSDEVGLYKYHHSTPITMRQAHNEHLVRDVTPVTHKEYRKHKLMNALK